MIHCHRWSYPAVYRLTASATSNVSLLWLVVGPRLSMRKLNWEVLDWWWRADKNEPFVVIIDKNLFKSSLPCWSPGPQLEWFGPGGGQKVWAGGLRCPPARLRPPAGSPGRSDLPPVFPQQAEPGRHHRSGPPGRRGQRRVPLLPDQERRAPHQHQLRWVGRGLRHGLPPSALWGNAHQDHPGCQPLQLQRRGVNKDRRPGGQALSRAQVQRPICVIKQ